MFFKLGVVYTSVLAVVILGPTVVQAQIPEVNGDAYNAMTIQQAVKFIEDFAREYSKKYDPEMGTRINTHFTKILSKEYATRSVSIKH